MALPLRRAALCAGIALTAALTGCSSSGSKSGGTSTPPTTPPSTPPSTNTVTTPAGTSSSSAAGTPADPATKAKISHAFTVFFNTDTPLGPSMAVLQHGTKFRQALIKESNSAAAQGITAQVSDVLMQGARVALVTFTLKSGTSDLLPNTHGYAVQEDGKWKVAAQTFCALLGLEGTAPAICNDKSITALPN
jgi:hypothetical protein